MAELAVHPWVDGRQESRTNAQQVMSFAITHPSLASKNAIVSGPLTGL